MRHIMIYDPLSEIIDEPLTIDAEILKQLDVFRRRAKLINLPGVDPSDEQERLSTLLDDLANRLLQGVEANPSKLWALTQFQYSLEHVEREDTEAREHFGIELEQLMDILGIASSDGLLANYLGGI